VIAFDRLGFGLSERPARFSYTPEAHAEMLGELVEGLRLTRFSLVVHDFGGPIALPLAAALPERIERMAQIPSLIIWGLGDRALPPRVLERLRQALPQARVAELAGVRHSPQEEAPDGVNQLLDGFLPCASDEPAMLRRA
jgi:pimeloyl-ACP methyl ester carboxylesterase